MGCTDRGSRSRCSSAPWHWLRATSKRSPSASAPRSCARTAEILLAQPRPRPVPPILRAADKVAAELISSAASRVLHPDPPCEPAPCRRTSRGPLDPRAARRPRSERRASRHDSGTTCGGLHSRSAVSALARRRFLATRVTSASTVAKTWSGPSTWSPTSASRSIARSHAVGGPVGERQGRQATRRGRVHDGVDDGAPRPAARLDRGWQRQAAPELRLDRGRRPTRPRRSRGSVAPPMRAFTSMMRGPWLVHLPSTCSTP